MFDALLRGVKDRTLGPLVSEAEKRRVGPTTVTAVGLLTGLAAAVAAAAGLWGPAVACWIVNRILDGLDGALARRTGCAGDLGGYLDLMADFVVYAAVPLGIAAGVTAAAGTVADVVWRPTMWPAAAALLAACYLNAASWMYLSAVLEKRGRAGDPGSGAQGLTSVVMPKGLVEGTETVLFYTFCLAVPRYAPPAFWLFGFLVLLTAVLRALWWVKLERRRSTGG